MPEGFKTRVAVIGAGKFGTRRAMASTAHSGTSMIVVADLVEERAAQLSHLLGCAATTNCKEAATRGDVDVVIVSTPTQYLAETARLALEAGKHVLVEKPFGRTPEEVLPLAGLAARNNLRLKAGYNHRYHPALLKAYELFAGGAIGRPLFLRCCYGHGGREGYEQEWRTHSDVSGGGELLDQGVHALDLFQWFAGSFEEVTGFVTTAYWPIAPTEDNAFALLRTSSGCVAQLHASWTNWKNIFTFEVFGETGSLTVSGLGGSYGPERLCFASRREAGSRPDEEWFEFPKEDPSLELEWADFVLCIAEGRDPSCGAAQAWQTLKLVQAIYDSDRGHRAKSRWENGRLRLRAATAVQAS
ncbi:MAG TPA: Gfo/Idh/MocA family oxidoreductase [Candidatus Acidoferrales bacterium]|nr:Gfo/Idh/MocA family oxidoreductase [Candidatus Acidoferrales bacterium]